MEKLKGYNNALLKAKNRGQVFEQLVTNDGITRLELAEKCGLTKMTITNIINEFIEKNVAVETAKSEEKKPGRKSTYMYLSPSSKKVIGLLIHRNHVSAALCDCQLHVLKTKTVHFSECDQEKLLEIVYALTDEMIKEKDVFGIGIGSIGPVDVRNGIILNPPGFFGIENVPIEELFRKRYQLPVYLDYHCNCAARVEKYFGRGRKYQNFIFLVFSEGVGLSIVINGKIYSRIVGVSSELGHMTVDYQGKPCFCGRRGCLGGYIDFSSEESKWETVKILCTALAGICDINVPQALFIKDEKSFLGDEHLEYMEEFLNQTVIVKNKARFKVYKASRSSELESVGCAANILGRIFDGEIEIK